MDRAHDTHATRGKRIRVIFFRTETGREPVREWLKSLPKQDRKRIGEDIKTVEFGWPIAMPVCRPMGGGLREVRTSLAQNRAARVLFWRAGICEITKGGCNEGDEGQTQVRP
jgi:phage-related protein